MRNTAPFVRRSASMTSLIDVVFLLLLFFMLTSTFSTFGEIELNQASSGAEAQDAAAKRAFVQLGASRLVLNGETMSVAELASRLEAGQVLVSLDSDVSAQRLVDLLVGLRGRENLSVLVLE